MLLLLLEGSQWKLYSLSKPEPLLNHLFINNIPRKSKSQTERGELLPEILVTYIENMLLMNLVYK